jgi:hypothetical protein
VGAQKTGRIPGLGPRLLEAALKAGWSRDKIKTDAGTWCHSEPAEKKMWVESMVGMLENRDGEWYKKTVGVGASEKDLKKMVEAWKEWQMRDEELVCFRQC